MALQFQTIRGAMIILSVFRLTRCLKGAGMAVCAVC